LLLSNNFKRLYEKSRAINYKFGPNNFKLSL
jgi:hypothetical protein